MKKTYIIPETDLMQADVEQMLAGSITSSNDGIKIGYGGVDDGSHDPEAKEGNWSIWED